MPMMKVGRPQKALIKRACEEPPGGCVMGGRGNGRSCACELEAARRPGWRDNVQGPNTHLRWVAVEAGELLLALVEGTALNAEHSIEQGNRSDEAGVSE